MLDKQDKEFLARLTILLICGILYAVRLAKATRGKDSARRASVDEALLLAKRALDSTSGESGESSDSNA